MKKPDNVHALHAESDELKRVRREREIRPTSDIYAFKQVRRTVAREIERRKTAGESTKAADFLHLDLTALANGIDVSGAISKQDLQHMVLQALRVGMMVGELCLMSEAHRAKAESDATKFRNARAGAASGEKRRNIAQAKWQDDSLAMAREVRSAQPTISQADLASEIQSLWKKDGKVPGHDSLLKLIKEAESSGRLVRRQTR